MNRNIFFIACNFLLALVYIAIAISLAYNVYNSNSKFNIGSDFDLIIVIFIGALFYVPLLAGTLALAVAENLNLLRIKNYLFVLMFSLIISTTIMVILVSFGNNMAGMVFGQLNCILCLVLGLNGISIASSHVKT
jgi:hypothetical protein